MLKGKVVGLGTFGKDGETFTGIIIECDRDDLWASTFARIGEKVIVQKENEKKEEVIGLGS